MPHGSARDSAVSIAALCGVQLSLRGMPDRQDRRKTTRGAHDAAPAANFPELYSCLMIEIPSYFAKFVPRRHGALCAAVLN